MSIAYSSCIDPRWLQNYCVWADISLPYTNSAHSGLLSTQCLVCWLKCVICQSKYYIKYFIFTSSKRNLKYVIFLQQRLPGYGKYCTKCRRRHAFLAINVLLPMVWWCWKIAVVFLKLMGYLRNRTCYALTRWKLTKLKDIIIIHIYT